MIFTHLNTTMFPIILKEITLIISHMKWAWDFLLHQSSCTPDLLQSNIDSHSIRQTVCSSDPAMDSNECAVCLCNIGAGDEIRELKCSHVFHSVCLDRWVGYGHWTCPLCRNHLRLLPRSDADFHQEVLVFNFGYVSSSNNGTWWLR
ncbi:hypothetical protein Pfo_023834 [Paulownia fortunei]|nr:hypothetical protein Pfo_023834 [Paulownia fortunei]